MFETALLNERYMDFFAHLDPFGFLKYGAENDRICLGTMEFGEGKTYDKPVGLLICRSTKDGLVIEWVYVDPEYRYQGLGTELIGYVFEESKKLGFLKLYTYITENEGRDKVCPDEKRLLEDYEMVMEVPSKKNVRLFREIIPEELMGAFLYAADVDNYFECIDRITVMDDPFYV